MTIKANTPNEYRPGTAAPTGTLTVTTDLAAVVESLHDLGFTVISPDETSFDVADLIRWAEGYGHPEEWAKRAQDAHARAERLMVERDRYREALRLIHDGLADHPRWHDIAPRFDGPMDVAKVAAQALDTPPTSKEENRT